MATTYDIVRLARVGSTQDEARRRATATKSPTLVVADEQSAGRGRQGREWVSPDRGMFSSFSFVSDWAVEERTLLPLIAAVAVRDGVRSVLAIDVGLRWPNDLIVDSVKVGGILVEASHDDVTVGCGLNLWWEAPMAQAQGLVPKDPGEGVALTLAEAWVNAFVSYLGAGSQKWPRDRYEAASVTLGREIVWGDGFGAAVAIAPDGALIVDVAGDLVELRAGEVHTRQER